jgi:hypothetical protein
VAIGNVYLYNEIKNTAFEDIARKPIVYLSYFLPPFFFFSYYLNLNERSLLCSWLKKSVGLMSTHLQVIIAREKEKRDKERGFNCQAHEPESPLKS